MIKQALIVARLFFLHLSNKLFLILSIAVLTVGFLLSVQLFKDYYFVENFYSSNDFDNSILINRISTDILIDDRMEELIETLEAEEDINKIVPIWLDCSRDASDDKYEHDFISLRDYRNVSLSTIDFVSGGFVEEGNSIILSENAKERYSIGDTIVLSVDNSKWIFDDEDKIVDVNKQALCITYVVTGFFASDSSEVDFSCGCNPPNMAVYISDSFSGNIELNESSFNGYYVGITKSFFNASGEIVELNYLNTPILKLDVAADANRDELFTDLASKYDDIGSFTDLNIAIDNYRETNRMQRVGSLVITCVSALLMLFVLVSDMHFGLINDKNEYQLYFLLGNTRRKLRICIASVYLLCCLTGWLMGNILYKAFCTLSFLDFFRFNGDDMFIWKSLLVVSIFVLVPITLEILLQSLIKKNETDFIGI